MLPLPSKAGVEDKTNTCRLCADTTRHTTAYHRKLFKQSGFTHQASNLVFHAQSACTVPRIKTQHRQHRLGREGQEDLKWEGVLGATDMSATVWQCLSYFQWKTGCWMQAEPIMPEVYHWNKLSLAVKFTLLVNFWGCQNLTAYATQWWTLTDIWLLSCSV